MPRNSLMPAADVARRVTPILSRVTEMARAGEMRTPRWTTRGYPPTIGWEGEYSLTRNGAPAFGKAPAVIARVQEHGVKSELLSHLVEANGRPLPVTPQLPWEFLRDYTASMARLYEAARQEGCELLATGVAMGFRAADGANIRNFADKPRYRVLVRNLAAYHQDRGCRSGSLRGCGERCDFSNTSLAIECGTSLQLHFETSPLDFGRVYNLLVALLGPLVALTANSAYFDGHLLADVSRQRLWEIGLGGDPEQMIPFAPSWLPVNDVGAYERWVSQYLSAGRPGFVPPDAQTVAQLRQLADRVPGVDIDDLATLFFYVGTTWEHIRGIFGLTPEPHLRWEVRPHCMPSTERDATALLAIYVGLITALWDTPATDLVSLAGARRNFKRCIARGLRAEVSWRGETQPVLAVLTELVRLAEHGLELQGFSAADRGAFLEPAMAIVARQQNGAVWQRRSVEALRGSGCGRREIDQRLVQAILANRSRLVVADWPIVSA